jgi:hypothetical protein
MSLRVERSVLVDLIKAPIELRTIVTAAGSPGDTVGGFMVFVLLAFPCSTLPLRALSLPRVLPEFGAGC